MRRKVIFSLLALLFLAVQVYCGIKFFTSQQELDSSQHTINKITKQFINHKQIKVQFKSREETVEEKPEFVLDRQALLDLKAQNNDVVGYIWFDSGIIREPVVQTTDNEYYLHKDINKAWSSLGTAFLNCKNTLDDMNLTIYGHTLIGALHADRWSPLNQMPYHTDYTKENSTFYLYTVNDVRKYEIAYVFNYMDYKNFDHQVTNLSEAEFSHHVNQLESRNTVDTGIHLSYGDQFITLQTCNRYNLDEVTIVVGKEIGRYTYA